MASMVHRTIFDVPTAEEKQGTATSLYDGAEALQTRLYRPLASVTGGTAGPTSGTNVSFSFESTDVLQWVPARTFIMAKLKATDTTNPAGLRNARWVSLPLAQLFSRATLRINSYTVDSIEDPGMIAQFNARTMLKQAEKTQMLTCAGFDISNDEAPAAIGCSNAGDQFVQPLSLIFGLCSTEYSMPHARVEMDFTIAPDLLQRLLVGNGAGGAANHYDNTNLECSEFALIASFARPAVPQIPVQKTIVYEFPNQQFHQSLIPESVTDVNLGVPASTYKLQVGFRRSGIGYTHDLCNFSQDWGVQADGSRLTDGSGPVGYLNSVTAKLGSATSPSAQFSIDGASALAREATAKRPFFESQMANGVLTGAVDGEAFGDWNDSSIYSLPIVREPTSRDTACVLQVRYGGTGPTGAHTTSCVVVTGRSILTIKYGEMGEEASVEASNYV
jgi:hypothetical protein